MKKILLIMPLLFYALLAFGADNLELPQLKTVKPDSHKWTLTDTALEITFLALLNVDRAQTVEVSKRPRPTANEEVGYARHFIGPHPTEHKVNEYFAACAVLHAGIAYVLPKPYRTLWQGVWIYGEYRTVEHNASVGIGWRF